MELTLKNIKFILLALLLAASQPAFSASSSPLKKVPFSDEQLPDNFGGNCKALTTAMNPLIGYTAATCRALKGVVMIKPTPAADKKGDKDVFYTLAFSSAGWAVNADYYGPGAYFVAGSSKWPDGCRMIQGDLAAYHQSKIKKGNDMGLELGLLLAESKKVECPDYLR
jgi:hypothetical protein